MEDKKAASGVSGLDLVILRYLNSGRGVEEVSELTKTKPEVLGKEIARLQLDGYISPEGTLTEKGLKAL
jgi:hypothetical protein